MFFTDKIVWIIGASEGIGRALAIMLEEQGARLAVSARGEARLMELVAELGGAPHIAVVCDVASLESISAAYQQVKSTLGVPDIIVHCAGVYQPMYARDLNLDAALNTMNINFSSALKLLSVALPDLRARRSGQLVLVSSVAGYCGLPNSMAYGASKAALSNLAESLRIELAAEGITVQLVSPGFVKTRLTDTNPFPMPFIISAEDAAARIASGMQSGRFEIHFPRRFSYFMKSLRIMPRWLFFKVMRFL